MNKFKLVPSERYFAQSDRLATVVYVKLQKCLILLAQNPYHPSLRTHKVQGVQGIFESRVDQQYRLTWEYGGKGVIVIRNVDNHDDCLKHP